MIKRVAPRLRRAAVRSSYARGVVVLLAAIASNAFADVVDTDVRAGESPRTTALEVKLGGYKPLIDSEAALHGSPYNETFGTGAMLLFEIEGDRELWQKFGTLGVGFSLGYAEKYAPALIAESTSGTPTTGTVSESTGFKVIPFKLGAVYRFDWAALHYNIPLVPYLKGGLAYTTWWVEKGGAVEYYEGLRAAGGKFGYYGIVGLSLMLDFFEPRLARDFDTDLGVNHSYFFAEYVYQNVNDFGGRGLDLSSRHWMFGLTLEY